MTTPLIPTKTILANTKYTPTDLIADTAVETFLANHYGFVRDMMSAYRAGDTSFSYTFPTAGDAVYMSTVIDTGTDYNYTVTGPEPSTPRTITVSWA